MTTLTLALVLLSALIHAGWNVLVKRAQDKLLFTWLLLFTSVILFTPLAIWDVLQGASLSWPGFVCVAATTLAYGGYFVLLARSYRYGDVSLAYPIARAVAPLATVAWGVLLLGERPSAAGALGIALVVGAAVLMGLPADLLPRQPVSGLLGAGAGTALLAAVGTGLFSSAYSAIDKVGVSLVSPILYIYLTFLGGTIVLLPLVWRRYGARAVLAEWRADLGSVAVAGIGCMGGYLLVLFALQWAPVSYVVPLRSTSILFTVMLGGWALQEGQMLVRLPLALALVVGIGLISWQG